ncbi:MAG: CBS domain-containing protein, partial [Proteobacteria bacterium]|nr:CBS domain-containing protein [Pseudomonadota bacterium]
IIFKIMRPITVAINFIARQSLRLIGVKTRSDITSHTSIAELRGLIDMHQGPGQDVIHERAMLKSILDLRSVQLSEIMVHRKNITMINASDPFETIVDQILASPFTRIPLWKNDPDNIVGVINAKVLLRAVRAHKDKLEELDILSLAHKPWFVPESTDLLEQLQAFRERREHFALVVDEYGSLMGIVTLEDILEEIVGDITDEHDIAVKGVRQQADGSYIIDGSVTIRDLNRQFDWGLSDESAATLAGLIIYETRKIPETGQIFMLNGFRFEILRRQRNQITLVRVTPPAALLEESEPSKTTHEETS